MAHLNDKLAEFFYEELPASEMVEARRHVAGCAQCRGDIQQFEKTHLALRVSQDVDVPRRIVFAPPERPAKWAIWDWRVLAPLATAAAALVISIVSALSPAPVPAAVTPVATAPAPVAAQIPPTAVDYDRIIAQVRESDRTWLSEQLAQRDREIRQLQGQLAYYESFQRTVMKETLENASSIQLLAQRGSLQDQFDAETNRLHSSFNRQRFRSGRAFHRDNQERDSVASKRRQ
jgi:hypothetical protein